MVLMLPGLPRNSTSRALPGRRRARLITKRSVGDTVLLGCDRSQPICETGKQLATTCGSTVAATCKWHLTPSFGRCGILIVAFLRHLASTGSRCRVAATRLSRSLASGGPALANLDGKGADITDGTAVNKYSVPSHAKWAVTDATDGTDGRYSRLHQWRRRTKLWGSSP